MPLSQYQKQEYGIQFAEDVINEAPQVFDKDLYPDLPRVLQDFFVSALTVKDKRKELVDAASDPKKRGALEEIIDNLRTACSDEGKFAGIIAHMAGDVTPKDSTVWSGSIISQHRIIRERLDNKVEEFCQKYHIDGGRGRR